MTRIVDLKGLAISVTFPTQSDPPGTRLHLADLVHAGVDRDQEDSNQMRHTNRILIEAGYCRISRRLNGRELEDVT
jgi:hypothetical protein